MIKSSSVFETQHNELLIAMMLHDYCTWKEKQTENETLRNFWSFTVRIASNDLGFFIRFRHFSFLISSH